MTFDVYRNPAEAPNPVVRVARFFLFGAQHKEAISPQDGTIELPVVMDTEGRWRMYPTGSRPGKKWLVIPTTLSEYTLFVNGDPITITVPADFDFDWAAREYFELTQEKLAAKALVGRRTNSNMRLVNVDKKAEKGKPVISFDILTGDQLFVDRFSFHFFPPKVGEGFVFRTGNIEDLRPPPGTPKDQYYIKRLVGLPGDELKIVEPTLYRNGAPITGSDAFEKNSKREDRYPGYVNRSRMGKGLTMEVPKNFFMALGDNSPNSYDGRYWGFIPAKDAVGRPLFIYFPFTRRWGPAK
jgi:signal peptidase I